MQKGFVRLVTGLVFVALLGGCASSPEFEGISPDELFEMGTREFDAGEWGEAIKVLEQLSTPGNGERPSRFWNS
jgi:outer membrane protein assembly factor BamD (BamD/ComL family)